MINETETVPGVEELMELVDDLIRDLKFPDSPELAWDFRELRARLTRLHAAAVHAPKLAAAAKDWSRGHNARGGDGPCECSVCDALAVYEQAMEVGK